MTLHASRPQPDAEARYQSAEALHRRGELAAAVAEYDAALALEPLHGPALHLSAMALYQQGNSAGALPRSELATRILEGQAEVWGAYGIVLAALGRAPEAAGAYRHGLDLDPTDGVLWFNLGLVERGAGRLDLAITAFAQAAARLGAAAASHELGLTQQMAGRVSEALDSYRQALSLGAGAETALNAGAACHELGETAEAEAFYRMALTQDPACASALNNLAAIAQDTGDHDQAAALCRRAIALEPSFADAYNNLGVSLLRLGDPEGALDAYHTALRNDPFNPKALTNLTELLFTRDRGGEAIAHHHAVAASRPDDPRSWLELARALERGDDLAGAAQALEQAARLDDRSWQAPHRLGELRQRAGDPVAAIEHHRRACALAPDQADAWRQLALAAVKAGDGGTALAGLANLLQRDPYDPAGWAYRALALRLTGQDGAANALTACDGLVTVINLSPPPDYSSLAAFHQALSADLTAIGLRAWSPRGQSVVGGFQTQNELFAEQAASIQALRRQLDAAVAEFLEDPGEAVRAFIPSPPRARRYHSWSITMRAGGRHAPHIHPEGCLSAVYYVETPGQEGSDDVGALEFGRPGFAVPLASDPPLRLIQPRPGALVLFPSYLWHGTRAFETPGIRTTVAFDLLR